MNQQDQIEQLEKSNQELKRQVELQAKQIADLKSPAQSDEERFAPYKGAGHSIILGPYQDRHEIMTCGENPTRYEYYAYRTKEQAEWEFKATQVRRKLQRICAVLGPAEDAIEGYTVGGLNYYPAFFRDYHDALHAVSILGEDCKYLDWNNSPEARDAREGRV